MIHPYISHTPEDVKEMLSAIGAKSVDELFSTIPSAIQQKATSVREIIGAMSEQEIAEALSGLAGKNANDTNCQSFLGAGQYRHFIPSVVDQLILRGEFLTSYTPYQPERAQGTLQVIFEFQTLMTQLTGMEVANAGLYDAGTALLEAVLLCLRTQKGKNVVLVPDSISPAVRTVLSTVVQHIEGVKIVPLPYDETSGQVSVSTLEKALIAHDGDVAAVVFGFPNYFGIFENLAEVVAIAHAKKALVVTSTPEALSLGIITPPGEFGVDVAVGDAQSFGVPLSLGGPSCGFLATREEFVRQLPGRLVGQTIDNDGRRGFVLTLSTREQHIRRERATSNICTNHNLLALCVTIYLSLLGKNGLRELSELNLSRRVYLEGLLKNTKAKLRFSGPRFNEFVLDVSGLQKVNGNAEKLISKCFEEKKILLGPALSEKGYALPGCLLISVTELNSKESLDTLGNVLTELS